MRASKCEENTKAKKHGKAVRRLGNKGKDGSPDLPAEYPKEKRDFVLCRWLIVIPSRSCWLCKRRRKRKNDALEEAGKLRKAPKRLKFALPIVNRANYKMLAAEYPKEKGKLRLMPMAYR